MGGSTIDQILQNLATKNHYYTPNNTWNGIINSATTCGTDQLIQFHWTRLVIEVENQFGDLDPNNCSITVSPGSVQAKLGSSSESSQPWNNNLGIASNKVLFIIDGWWPYPINISGYCMP